MHSSGRGGSWQQSKWVIRHMGEVKDQGNYHSLSIYQVFTLLSVLSPTL